MSDPTMTNPNEPKKNIFQHQTTRGGILLFIVSGAKIGTGF